MPLAYEIANGTFCPIVICDFCAEQIIQHGNVECQYDTEDPTDIITKVYFSHKGCSTALRDAIGGTRWLWFELSASLVWLCRNTLDDADSTQRVIEMYQRFRP